MLFFGPSGRKCAKNGIRSGCYLSITSRRRDVTGLPLKDTPRGDLAGGAEHAGVNDVGAMSVRCQCDDSAMTARDCCDVGAMSARAQRVHSVCTAPAQCDDSAMCGSVCCLSCRCDGGVIAMSVRAQRVHSVRTAYALSAHKSMTV